MSTENSKNSRIILGEASESDSENESETNTNKITDENPTTTAMKTMEQKIQRQQNPQVSHENVELIRKNLALRTKLCDYSRKTIDKTHRELTMVSRQLLRSELILQESVSSLNVIRQNIRNCGTILTTITTGNYLPEVDFATIFYSSNKQ